MSFRGKAGAFWNNNGGLILTIFGAVCGIASTIMMYDAAPKAQKAISDAENQKWDKFTDEHSPDEGAEYEPLTTMEKIKVVAPIVGPSIGVSILGAGCTIGAYGIGAHKLIQTTQALNSAITAKEVFEHAVEANVSTEKMEKIRKDVADQHVQNNMIALPKDVSDDGLYSFIEPISGQVFRATTEIVRQGCLDFNEIMMNQDKATLTDLMMCWINKGAKGLTLTSSTDAWFWKADHEKDWLKINTFSPISNDYGNPASYINYNRDAKKN